MNIEILHRPSNTAAKVTLGPNETITSEAGAMIAMSGDLSITTSTHQKNSGGGFLKALKRMFAGESFFLNHFEAGPKGGELYLATSLQGDMQVFEGKGESLIIQSGAFVACEQSISIEPGWQGFKNLFSGESMFWLKSKGTGKFVLSSFGAIYPVKVDGAYIVDTGHIVAFDETLNFKVSKAAKGWIASFASGEGLVCRFEGKGTVWCQSHNPSSFGWALSSMLRPRSS
ncbi:MAG TPA: TIGR00266 family protein [Leptospiraceae bacterium]|nr:TIGR00266 family protein [Leptospiraceae bacterium]HNF16412.1 TIGR00266 family protein [Leptospiraceae bacterium]HNF27125.1 TIGR00266 family protein [Leptospiraceae bacterium]HNI98134.1 TIGR00266 family protein [Leptospiraceae bacterium]HNM05651.1 TIGR00266 family protein [Leptospiraceae bacterium]